MSALRRARRRRVLCCVRDTRVLHLPQHLEQGAYGLPELQRSRRVCLLCLHTHGGDADRVFVSLVQACHLHAAVSFQIPREVAEVLTAARVRMP